MIAFIDLCQSIVDVAEQDRALQRELAAAGEWGLSIYHPRMRACNEQNAAVLMDFLHRYGWPVPSKYGIALHESAWWIAAHAISLPHVQRYALQLLTEAYMSGETVGPEYAKIFDKVALHEGRLQRYGTQFNSSPDGWMVDALENPKKVDEYRAQVGLPTLEETTRDWCSKKHHFNEPCECGGVADTETAQRFEREFVAFLHEVGWR